MFDTLTEEKPKYTPPVRQVRLGKLALRERASDYARNNLLTAGVSFGVSFGIKAAFAHAAVAITTPLVTAAATGLGIASSSIIVPIAAAALAGAAIGAVAGAATNVISVKMKHPKYGQPLAKGWWLKALGKGAATGATFGALGGVLGGYFHHLYAAHHHVPVPKPAPPPPAPFFPSDSEMAITQAKAAIFDTLNSGLLNGHDAHARALHHMAERALGDNNPKHLQHALKEISFRLDWHHHTPASRALGMRLIKDGNRIATTHDLHDVNSRMLLRDWKYVSKLGPRFLQPSPA